MAIKPLICFFILLLAAMRVDAFIILDQQNPLPPKVMGSDFASFCGTNSCAEWQQGVTVGIAGTLAGLDLFFTENDVISTGTLSIWSGSPWQSGTPVYSTEYSATGLTYFDLSLANINLSVGDLFTFGLSGGPNGTLGGPEGSYNTNTLSGNYADGELWNNNYPNCNGGGTCPFDLAFNSYMSVTDSDTCSKFPGGGATGGQFPGGGNTGGCFPGQVSVPEPGTLPLLALSLAAIIAVRRQHVKRG